MDLKSAFGAISVIVAIIGYIPYIRDVLIGKTKPHALSWLVWACLSGIAFAVQVVNNGGAGAWLMGITATVTLIIFLLALYGGDSHILAVDWLSLSLAAIALAWWFFTDNPLFSIILISFTDAIGGFFPTVRKSFSDPNQETLSMYLMYAVSLVFSLIALSKFDLINALYSATFVVVNIFMVTFLYIRRKQLAI